MFAEQKATDNEKVSAASDLYNHYEGSQCQSVSRPVQRKPNNTGLPDSLKTGIENLSGYSMDDVKVQYNSSKPAQLNAHAYAQGTDIHLASGQERHLPHEAWHVVQQKQGRVKSTMQMKNVAINDDTSLEKEADVMGRRAALTPYQLINPAQLISRPSNDTSLNIYNASYLRHTSNSLMTIQRGGSEWTPHDGRELIKKIGEKGEWALFYTKDSSSYYVEAWKKIEKGSRYAGAVQLEPKGEYLAMHTRSEAGMEGGVGGIMMQQAIKIVANNHTNFSFVQLTPAPGAASKKVIELLSEKVGTPDIHAEAAEFKKLRIQGLKNLKKPEGEEEDRDKKLQTWSPYVLPEHKKHLESLVSSKRTSGIKIAGPAGGLIGFPEAPAGPDQHIEKISKDKDAPGYGIEISMKKFLEISL